MLEEYAEHDLAVYGGYLCDDEKLMESTSGGIATALSEYMIEQGGYVAGVAYSEDFYSAEYVLINNKHDIRRLKGSKYIESNKNNIYADVKKLLDADKKVLFFGLPCVVAALYEYIGTRHNNLLTCELICHGPTNRKIHKDYVMYLEEKYQSKTVEFSVRHKKDEWSPGYLYAKFENGDIFMKPFYETEYGFAFSVLGRESCYNCKFKGNNRRGDIMIGDFWGVNANDEFWNKRGVSVIFAETEKGNAFIKSTPNIKLFPTTFEKAVEKNQMVIKSKHKKTEREKFSKSVSEKGLIYAANNSVNFRKRVIFLAIKRIIKKYLFFK